MLFLSDLDNTLIFSYKKLSADNLCVETKDGKALSYMTPREAELFGEAVKKCLFIPVTTRSVEQYKRIAFPDNFVPEYAVCCNGGQLLVNGQPDPEWRTEPEHIFLESEEELNACKAFWENRNETYLAPRIVDDCFLFAKSSTPEATLSLTNAAVPSVKTDRYLCGDKIYAVPKGINKAAALRRIRSRFGDTAAAAAGDSLFDEPMLAAADIAIVKKGELSGRVINKFQITEISGDAPEFVLSALLEIIDNYSNSSNCGTYKPDSRRNNF